MNKRVAPVLKFQDDGDAEAGWSNNNGESWPDQAQEKDGQDQLLSPLRALSSRGSLRSLHNTTTKRRNSAKVVEAFLSVSDKEMEVVDVEAEYADELADLAKPKEIAQSMAGKRRYSKSVRKIETIKAKRISSWKTFKMKVAMAWKSTKSTISEWARDYELWKGHLKEVEGNFGTGVSAFFLFLKQLFFLNMLTFMLEFSLVSLPTIAIETNIASQTKTNACSFDQNSSSSETVSEMAVDFISGQGWLNTTLMFYAGYPASKLISESGVVYNLPLAYILVGMAYFLVSLLIVLRSLAKGFKTSISQRLGTSWYCNKIFAGWDYCITEQKAAKVKSANLFQSIRADKAEEERLNKVKSRSTKKKCQLYTIRCLISLYVVGLLGGAIYAIYVVFNVSTDPVYLQIARQKDPRLVQLMAFAPSLTITILNVILPILFRALCHFEDWSPDFEVSIYLFRMILLKMASLVVLILTLFASVDKRCMEEPETCCQQNWENQLASQMYMLIWTDFFARLFTLLIVNTLRKLLYAKCCKKLGLPEFNIAEHVLDLVHDECLIWIGTFYSPILPAMGVIKLFIMFYVTKVSVMFTMKPPSKVYRASRSNYLFMILLLIAFFMCVFAVGWSITRMRPSCLGPFSNKYCSEDATILSVLQMEVDLWPTLVRRIVNFATTATFLCPILVMVCLMLLYFKFMTQSLLDSVEVLKDQLVLDGRENRILMDRLAKYEINGTADNTEHDNFPLPSKNAQQTAVTSPTYPKSLEF